MPRYIGKEMSRVDGVAKVTGRAKLKGTIKTIDTQEAARAAGVARIFTHLNTPKLGPKPATEQAPPTAQQERDKSF